MNTKIIVALVIGIALIGLTGAASASLYDDYVARSSGNINTNTEITGTHFSSESYTKSSNMNIQDRYDVTFVAPLVGPTFPPADLCIVERQLEGRNYRSTIELSSSPSRNTFSTSVINPREVAGSIDWFTCVEWGLDIPPQAIALPQESDSAGVSWQGAHPAGSAYPAHSRESHSISWGSWSNWP
jgi:hypothetical protein